MTAASLGRLFAPHLLIPRRVRFSLLITSFLMCLVNCFPVGCWALTFTPRPLLTDITILSPCIEMIGVRAYLVKYTLLNDVNQNISSGWKA